MSNFDGLCNVNIELTDKCNKNCWMCGRRKRERESPDLLTTYGEMKFEILESIAKQLPSNIVVQLHNNGEPLLYSRFGDAVDLFSNQITNITTNGKLLMERATQIIGKLDTMAISIIQNDLEREEQFKIIEEFLKEKGKRKPLTILRVLGRVNKRKYKKLNVPITTRTLHNPMGSFDYDKTPMIPEIGICLDMLHHLAISRKGEVSICVRFDPDRKGVIGLAGDLEAAWCSPIRKLWIRLHKENKREAIPLCSKCDFYGVPTGA